MQIESPAARGSSRRCHFARRRAGNARLWMILGGAAVGLIVLTCAGILLSGEGGVAKAQKARKDAIAAFAPELPGYLSPPGLKDADAEVLDGKFKGKVVCLDKAKGIVDDDYFVSVAEPIRAWKPADVGAVVWLEWDKKQAGTYDDGTKGYLQTCRVTVIDKATAAVVARGKIEGDPVKAKSGSGDTTGTRPWDKVAKFLSDHSAGT